MHSNRDVTRGGTICQCTHGEVTDRTDWTLYWNSAGARCRLNHRGFGPPCGFIIPNPLTYLDSDRFVFGALPVLTEAVQCPRLLNIGAQLNHLGRWQPVSSLEGRQPVSSSPVPCMFLGEYPLPSLGLWRDTRSTSLSINFAWSSKKESFIEQAMTSYKFRAVQARC